MTAAPSSPEEKERISLRARAEGYLTIFLALSLSAILALFFVLLSGLRQSAVRMRLESVTRIAAGSVLAEFHPVLHRRYDLFMIDTGYGTQAGSLDHVCARLRLYLEENCRRTVGRSVELSPLAIESLQVPQARFACDGNGKAVREQVYAYMTADPAGAVLGKVLVSADQWHGLEISGRDWEVRREENTQELKEALQKGREKAEQTLEEAQENGAASGGRAEAAEEALYGEKPEAEQMVDEMERFMLLPLLRQIFGDISSLSQGQVDPSAQLSRRAVRTGSGLVPVNSHGYPAADELLFNAYISEKCGCYTQGPHEGPLRYEQEYILCGEGADAENLEGTARRLMFIREGANCLCLLGDEGRKAKVSVIAGAASLLLFHPELEKPLETALILGWSYLESLQDLRVLYAGGKVPLSKTPEEWQTSLLMLLDPQKKAVRTEGTQGLTYEQYLAGLLYMEGGTRKTQRTMDIMEMNIRETDGNGTFLLDNCIDALQIGVRASCGGYACSMETAVGYD